MESNEQESPPDELTLKLQLIAAKEQKIRLMEGLPFLYGWKWYTWAREFFESTNRLNFLCAANQISKSSTQIRKCLDWATNEEKWPKLWGKKPTQFWYLYPSQKVVDAEFKTKWTLFLPRGHFKDEGPYAWKPIIQNKEIRGIYFFNLEVYVFFKTYSQDTQDLQSGTCDAIFCDEELPVNLYDELIFRISSSDGYFHMVFTATLGQEFWREVIEARGDKERLQEASKWQVSMYDCMTYEDGTASHWTEERIGIVKSRCKSHSEVLRRVYGRFVLDEGRKYEQFDIKRHYIEPRPIPNDWAIYVGVDPGSGGKNHPAAIVFVAVRPDFRYGEVFMGWRGDNVSTTSADVVEKFIQMKGKMMLSGQYYDFADRDFYEISSSMGEPFQAADKSHEKGESVINVLFKNDMLFIHDLPELEGLGTELSYLRLDTPKRLAKDDFCDGMRYAITRIPWDYSGITGMKTAWPVKIEEKKITPDEERLRERREWADAQRKARLQESMPSVEQELEEYAAMFDQ